MSYHWGRWLLVGRDPAGIGFMLRERETWRWHNFSLAGVDLPAEEIRSLVAAADSTLWLGTDGGLYRLDPAGTAQHYTEVDGLPDRQITGLAFDKQGRLWIGTAAGLGWLNGEKIESCPGMDGAIWSLTVDPEGGLWLVTPAGIGLYPSQEWQPVAPDSTLAGLAEGRAAAVDGAERTEFGSSGGVAQEFPGRALFTGHDLDWMSRGENLLDNCVTALQVDAAGRLWAGTPAGLWYMEQQNWRRCQPGLELTTPLANIQAITLLPATQQLWVGGWRVEGAQENNGSGLRCFTGTIEVPLPEATPQLPHVNTLTCDTRGRLWAAAEEVIYCFDGRQWTELPLPDEAGSEVIQALLVTAAEVIWCGTNAGLWRYEERRWQREKLDIEVQALVYAAGEVWAGTVAGLKWPGTQRNSWVRMKGLPRGGSVTALLVDQNGVVWAGTTAGLVRISNRYCQVFTTFEQGLASNFVQALAAHGHTLWIGTANGLSRLTTGGI